MPLKSARRLPRKYNRPTSAKSRELAHKRRKHHKQLKKERLKRSVRRMERLLEDMRRFALRWVLVVLVGILLVGLCILLFSPLVTVQEIKVLRDNPRLDIEQVQQTLAPLFRKHLVFLSEYEVRSLLTEEISDIESIEVTKAFPSQLQVHITLDPFIAKVNILNPQEANQEESEEVITGSGSQQSGAVLQSDFLTSEGAFVSVGVPVEYGDIPQIDLIDWGVRPQPGERLLDPTLIQTMNDAEEYLEQQFAHTVARRTIFVRGQEFHLDLGDYELWFDMQSPLAQQLKRYRTFLQAVDRAEVTQYIDLRISDRIIYK